MTNNALSQAAVTASIPAVSGYSGGEGIQFDEEGYSAEERRLEVIKNKIFEKLVARMEKKSRHGGFNGRR